MRHRNRSVSPARAVARALTACAAAGVLAVLAACDPIVTFHGYAPIPEELSQIAAGQDTRGSVRRKIGRPSASGIFTDDGWYYIASRTEQYAYSAPEITERRVVAITFDAQDVVASVNEYGLEDGRIIDLETRTTPTYGRELTVLEQAFGNLGTIRAEDFIGNE